MALVVGYRIYDLYACHSFPSKQMDNNSSDDYLPLSMLLSVGFSVMTTSSNNGFDQFVFVFIAINISLLYTVPMMFIAIKVKRNLLKYARAEGEADVERSSSSSQTSSKRMVH